VIFRGNNFALPLAGSSKYAIVELPSVTNSIGMKLVRIPAGSFLIGDSPARMRQPGDEPLRKVQIARPYFLSVTEVTREQYRTLMGLAPDGSKQYALLPVDNVSWTDAVEFCKNLSKHEGTSYRLPTEVEWEYACRAGSESVYGRTGNLDDVAWYSSNSGMKLHAVATKAPNTWGIYDMQGNVAEWCEDIFLPVVSSLPQWRVVRGGSAMDGPNNCRTIDRKGVDPRYGWPGLGFRVALDP
jgi:formylglycine-generating enzyme required for sulfatase activity